MGLPSPELPQIAAEQSVFTDSSTPLIMHFFYTGAVDHAHAPDKEWLT